MTTATVLSTSPHFHKETTVPEIMWNVVYALVPVCLYSVYQFGLSIVALLAVCILACVLTEHLCCWAAGKASTVRDGSALITGILLALVLPPGFPLWMAVVAGVVSIGLGKMFFGGLGFNIMNPALVGRAFCQAAFTSAMTTWVPFRATARFTEFIPTTLTFPFLQPGSITEWVERVAVDGFSGATPLALLKFDQVRTEPVELFLGTTAGSAGEASALIIILGGVFLVAKRAMDWRIPVAILLSAALFSYLLYELDPAHYPSPLFTIFSGGLMLGAVFMATDMVGSPVTPKGVWIYGAFIGVLTVVIRVWGGQTEGVMYAILLGNVLTPLINRATQPRKYGAEG